MSIEPFFSRKYSDRELARLQALKPLADEIAEAVLAHIEGERCIIKDQIARKIWLELTGAAATILWEDPPGTKPVLHEAHAVPHEQPTTAAGGEVHVVTKDERWIITEALREKADAFLKRLSDRRVSVVGRLRTDYRHWSEDANRLARLIDHAGKVDIWADA